MVSEIQEMKATLAPELWIPEFGVLDTAYLDERKKYQGRIYKLAADKAKSLPELFGFTAAFDSPKVKSAFIDIIQSEGHIIFEIERNTKPTDLELRYARDRWDTVDSFSSEKYPLRPWTINSYYCKFLPEKIFAALADQLSLKQEHLPHFYIRLNFKDRVFGLIAEDSYIDEFPPGSFQIFALPQDHVPVIATIPATEVQAPLPLPTRKPNATPADSGPRYATYSQSEIDRMFKLQSESITSAIGGKVSAQQRVFQEAIIAQEKTFNKIADKFLVQFEDVRTKIGNNTRDSQAIVHQGLEQFRNQLSKELDQFRSHLNKTILSLPRSIEEKIQSLQALPKAGNGSEKNLKPVLVGLISAVLILTLANIAITCASFSSFSNWKTQITSTVDK